MDDLDLIRCFSEEDGEPDAGARERVAAQVTRGIEARSGLSANLARTARSSHRLRRLTIALTAAAVVLVAVSFGAAQLLRPNLAEAAVQFSQDGGGYIVAIVKDPFAARDQLRAAFAAHGLDIDLKLVPVSPSLVGSVVSLGIDGRSSGIETLHDTKYAGPKGEQTVGLRIPTEFKGHASIVLGRPAKPGETYDSAGDAFVPGEALQGVDLVGMKVAAAVNLLDEMGLTVAWRVDDPAPRQTQVPDESKPTAAPTPGTGTTLAVDAADIHKYDDYYVTQAVPMAEGSVYVFAAAERTK